MVVVSIHSLRIRGKMDVDSIKTIAEIAATVTAQGVLLWAWMLERKNVEKERERADRNESVIIRILESMAAIQKLGGGQGL
jgi:hypothetical protein